MRRIDLHPADAPRLLPVGDTHQAREDRPGDEAMVDPQARANAPPLRPVEARAAMEHVHRDQPLQIGQPRPGHRDRHFQPHLLDNVNDRVLLFLYVILSQSCAYGTPARMKIAQVFAQPTSTVLFSEERSEESPSPAAPLRLFAALGVTGKTGIATLRVKSACTLPGLALLATIPATRLTVALL